MVFKNKNIKCVSFTDFFFLQGNKNNKSIFLFQILIMNCCQNSHKVDKSMRIICSCYTFSEYQVEETSGTHANLSSISIIFV